MAVSVKRTDAGIGAVPSGTKITLDVSPTLADDTFKWERAGHEEGTAAALPITVDVGTTGKYTVTVTHKVSGTDTAEFNVSLAAESKPFYEPSFAKMAAIVIGIISALVLLVGSWRILDKSGSDWSSSGGNLMFAATITLPVIILGGLALAVGLFMAAVEWRGRFKPEEQPKPAPDPEITATGVVPDNLDKIIDSIGKLQGATLVLIVGLLLLLGSVWGVASSAAGTSPSASASPSATPRTSPSATAAPTR